jgi:hypothetical protein
MKQRLMRVTMVAALALGMSALVAQPSGAAAPLQKCTKLTGSAKFSPGLSLVPANNTVTAKGTVGGCTPLKATGGSGALSATIKVPGGSCAKLAGGKQKLSGTASTVWKNKKVTKYNLTFTTGSGAAGITTATITGKATTGLFKGHKVTGQIKFTIPAAQNCTVGHPVKSITFKQTKPWVIV